MTALVELAGVSFSYGAVSVLEEISLTVQAGDFLGVIGPNGAGKTTLLKLVLGLLPPARGTIQLFGQPVSSFRGWHRIGYVPQKVHFDSHLPATVEEVLSTGLAARRGFFRGMGAAHRSAVKAVLALVGMEPHRATRIGALSAGQQQRVLIGRALVTDPEILVLDEPTGGVDPEAQASFYALLHALNRHRGVTLVLVSHDLAVVAQEVTKLACLNRRLIFHGHPGEFLTDAGLAALYGPSVRPVLHRH